MENRLLRINRFLLQFNLANYIEKINKYVLVFAVLTSCFLSFSLNGNEEQYMLFAKQYMDPNWITSWYLNEFPGTRLLYQMIIGFFLKYFSFESVLFCSRLILCFLYAHALSGIYRYLKITNVQILLHLPVLFLFNQSMFADSWFLLSVEPKGLAYVFILYAIYFYIKSNVKMLLLFLIFATYFHVLVGGFAFVYFMASVIVFDDRKYLIRNLKWVFIYALTVIPLVFYLKTAVMDKVEFTPTVDWIYTYFRSPHHTALFKDISYFYSKHLYGILTAVVTLFFSIYLFRFKINDGLKRLNHFVFLSLIGVLFTVVIAFFDEQGVLLKYYPFRINTLTTFSITLIISAFVFSSFKKQRLHVFANMITMISLLFLLKLAQPNLTAVYKYIRSDEQTALVDITNYIKENMSKDAVVLSFINDLSLNRRMERDRFVVYKFIPAEMNRIPEWYERELYKRELAKNLSILGTRDQDYKIDYYLSQKQTNSSSMELVKSNSRYFLYKLKK